MISLTINYTKPLPWCGLQTYANRVLKRCLRCGYLFKGNGKRNSTAKHKNSLSENKIYSQPVHQITEKNYKYNVGYFTIQLNAGKLRLIVKYISCESEWLLSKLSRQFDHCLTNKVRCQYSMSRADKIRVYCLHFETYFIRQSVMISKAIYFFKIVPLNYILSRLKFMVWKWGHKC